MNNRQCLFPFLLFLLAVLIVGRVESAEDGLARTPPLGWRNWYMCQADISQTILLQQARGLLIKRDPAGRRSEDGVSLKELGYVDVGLDDNWQACRDDGIFHDAYGVPIINTTLFPNLTAMVETIHDLGLTAGWYHNNCICAERKNVWPDKIHYYGDVVATIQYGFDSVKLDGCGAFRDLDLYYNLYSFYRPILTENCHWGADPPRYLDNGDIWCPFHFYRTSGDLQLSWGGIFRNFQSTLKYNISQPGCWAYPDMIVVGALADFYEDRAHFGAWAIVSSPLLLSYDLTDDALAERVWPIVANRHAIAINQGWAGEAGTLIQAESGQGGEVVQVWSKRLPGDSLAIFVINNNQRDDPADEIAIVVPDLPRHLQYNVFDVWKQETAGTYTTGASLEVAVRGHDSVFLRLDPQSKSQRQQDS